MIESSHYDGYFAPIRVLQEKLIVPKNGVLWDNVSVGRSWSEIFFEYSIAIFLFVKFDFSTIVISKLQVRLNHCGNLIFAYALEMRTQTFIIAVPKST